MSITFNAHSPIHRQIESLPSSALVGSGMTWSRTIHWIVTTAKRILPAIAVFALIAAVVAATIALRLAIWLPLYYRH